MTAPVRIPSRDPRRPSRPGRVRTALAVSEGARIVPPITLPTIGGSYLYRDGTLFLDGVAQERRRAG